MKKRCPRHDWKWTVLKKTPFSTEYIRRCLLCRKKGEICTGAPWARCRCGIHDGRYSVAPADPKAELKRLAGVEEE